MGRDLEPRDGTGGALDAASGSALASGPDPGDDLVSLAAACRRMETWAVHRQLVAVADLLRVWSVSDADPRPGSPASSARRRRGYDVDPAVLVRELVVTEIALASGIGEQAAADRVTAAEALIIDGRLPVAAAAMAQGTLDWPRTWVIVSRTRGLTPGTARLVDERVTPSAPRLTLPALRRRLDTGIAMVDDEVAASGAARARRDRRVCVGPGVDGPGAAELWMVGPAEAVTAAYQGLDAAARHLRSAGDARTLDQLRHDLLVTACTTGSLPGVLPVLAGPPGTSAPAASAPAASAPAASAPAASAPAASAPAASAPGAATGVLPARPGPESEAGAAPTSSASDPSEATTDSWFATAFPDVTPTVTVTVSLETLLGLTEDPAFLGDHGPVPAQLARDLAANGIWRCVAVDDSHGTVLGVASSTFTPGYAPGARLKKFLEHAAPRCSMTGCRTRAVRCDVDHRVPYGEGGATCSCNAQPLCRRHHRLKTAGLLTSTLSTDPAYPPGTVQWTTRTGRDYLSQPHVPLPHVTEARQRGSTESAGDTGGSSPPEDDPPF